MRSIGVATRQYKPSFNMVLTDGNGQTYSITNGDVQSDSLAIRTGTSNSGELTLGAAVIGSLSVVLLNDDKNSNKYDNVAWRGAHIEAAFTVHGASVSLGTFYVNEHSEQGGTIRVVAYDSMQVLDGYKIYEHNFTYPLDAVTAVNTIATARGLRVSGLTGVSLSLPDPGTDQMSERAFLSYVAQILCKYVVIKRLNGYDTIFFGWYDTAHPVANAGTTFSHDLATSDYNPENFQIKVYDSNYTVTVRGTGGTGPLTNAVYIENNPFIRSSNVGLPNPGGGMAYDIYTQVHALTYRPGSADIVADIALEAGDVITVSTGPLGGTYTMIITNLTFGTGLTMSISSDADPSDDMIFNPSTYFKKATQQAISDELADADSELSQALGGGGGDPDLELISIPAVQVIAAVDANDEPTMGFYDGFTTEFAARSAGHFQATPTMTYRKQGQSNNIGGIEIMEVTIPAQKIYIPKATGDKTFTDILVTGIRIPDCDEYHDAGINEATHACVFYPQAYYPAKIRVQVERQNDYIRIYDCHGTNIGDSNTNPTRMRPCGWFSGHDGPMSLSYSSRLPECDIPLPGFYFFIGTDPVMSNKWCYMVNNNLVLVPDKYLTYT